jgi:hypothetical protein
MKSKIPESWINEIKAIISAPFFFLLIDFVSKVLVN